MALDGYSGSQLQVSGTYTHSDPIKGIIFLSEAYDFLVVRGLLGGWVADDGCVASGPATRTCAAVLTGAVGSQNQRCETQSLAPTIAIESRTVPTLLPMSKPVPGKCCL